MPFLAEATRLISQPTSPFFGTSDQRLLLLHHAYSRHYQMHRHSDGQTTSLTMRREAFNAFRAQYDVSEAQYRCLGELHNSGEVGDIESVYRCSLPQPVSGVRSDYVERYFTVPVTICCGTAVQARPVEATFYDVDQCCSARHYVMKCKGACGASYHLNKRILSGSTPENDVRMHEFYAWESGRPPEFIASKSGRSIMSARFLADVAFTLCRMRVGFRAIVEKFNVTVRRRCPGTTPLTTDSLIECWSIFCVLKLVQEAVPWHWFPPDGQEVLVSAPQTTVVTDIVGEQQGVKYWAGLRNAMDTLLENFWARVPWSRHSCDVCRRTVDVDGNEVTVHAAALDGIRNTRGFKCAVYNCPSDLIDLRGSRFCADHEGEYGHLCAVTVPPCPHPHEPHKLACANHAHLEDRWTYYNQIGSYRRKQRMRAMGEDFEPDDIKQLRIFFSRHQTHGNLLGTWNCGIIAGMSDLLEHEGTETVIEGLDEIFPFESYRPTILFYDNACKLRRWRLLYPHVSWMGTRYIVDRFHFKTHTELDCAEFNSPEARDDPCLWHIDPETGAETFLHNSSMAESSNSFLTGFGTVAKQMPRTLRQFFLNQQVLVRNELLLKEKLLGCHPTFS